MEKDEVQCYTHIGIMGAMIEEVDALKKIMTVHKVINIGHRTYYSGSIHHVAITLVFSRWGKVASSSTVTTLINQFNVDFVIFTGVAGAVDRELNRGDIVISSALYQYDMDARPFFSRFQIPLTETSLFEPKKENIIRMQKAAKSFVDTIQEKIPQITLKKFSIDCPKVYIGVIASGDQFVSNPLTHQTLKLNSKKVLAVEMEGAAVAQVCDEHDIPYIVVRTISDKADHTASTDFKAFIAEVARHYSEGIVSNFIRLSEIGDSLLARQVSAC